MDAPITSPANPQIKAARRLRERRAREESGRFLIEGEREVARAQYAGVAIDLLFYCAPNLAEGVDLTAGVEVAPRVMERLAVRDRGVVAVAQIPERPLAALPRPPRPVYLVADGVEKPGNLGALLRSADGAGVDGVIVCGATDPWNPNAVRASLGTCFTVAMAIATTAEAIVWLGALPIVVATPEAAQLYTEVPLWGAIVVGREDVGVSSAWRQAATVAVRIPMRGVADSLNVAQTATLLAYAAR
ncbi:MAG TPA: RNA methyltransferase [Proteobacteria bacterium]|nr:MAG: RNA methyltransferase [Nitrospirae bacterium CG_4_9_14_0_8_um_filter_70_14]HBB40260.1 RNA methyltransferase [Pseudomonadota bacterium]